MLNDQLYYGDNDCVQSPSPPPIRGVSPSADADAAQQCHGTRVVTIAVKPVNEAPMITAGPTTAKQRMRGSDDNADGDAELIASPPTLPADNEPADTWHVSKLHLVADRARRCGLQDRKGYRDWGPIDAKLSFKNAPNFEKPADADMDNVYMVTVVVTDPGEHR